mgnify:CR=1 FL=1
MGLWYPPGTEGCPRRPRGVAWQEGMQLEPASVRRALPYILAVFGALTLVGLVLRMLTGGH